MKKQLLKSALIAVAGVGLLAGSAMATLIVTVTDGTTTNTFSDNGGLYDTDGDLGSLELSSFYVGNWKLSGTISTSSGMIANANPTYLGISSLEATTTTYTSGSLTITVTDTYLASTPGVGYTTWTTSMSETTMSAMTATLKTTIDDGSPYSNPLITLNKPANISDYQGDQYDIITPLIDDPFSITSIITITGPGTYNFTASTNASLVPEPATMLLFGTGLAGLAGLARRRKAD